MPTRVAEQHASPPFLLAAPGPTVVAPYAIQNVAVMPSRRSGQALSAIASQALPVLNGFRRTFSTNLVSYSAVVTGIHASFLGFSATGIFGAILTAHAVALTIGHRAPLTPSEFALSCTTLIAGVGAIALGRAAHRIARAVLSRSDSRDLRKLETVLAPEVQKLESALASATELERAWFADRARGLVTSLRSTLDQAHPRSPLSDSQKGRDGRRTARARLGSISEVSVSDDVRAQVAILAEVAHIVYGDDAAHLTPNVTNTLSNLEYILHRIEQLRPDARALLQGELGDALVAAVGQDPGNRWRLKRLRDTMSGERCAYAAGDFAVPAVDLDALRSATAATAVADAGLAVLAISRLLIKEPSRASVVVSDATAAENAAAYFENRGLRATLYDETPTVTLTVYRPEELAPSVQKTETAIVVPAVAQPS